MGAPRVPRKPSSGPRALSSPWPCPALGQHEFPKWGSSFAAQTISDPQGGRGRSALSAF